MLLMVVEKLKSGSLSWSGKGRGAADGGELVHMQWKNRSGGGLPVFVLFEKGGHLFTR